jgi:hypothetical protein
MELNVKYGDKLKSDKISDGITEYKKVYTKKEIIVAPYEIK